MKRRLFLGTAAAAAAAAAWPRWLRRAFADTSVTIAPGAGSSSGKPVLVLLIPDDAHKYERGTAWGSLINHGSDEELWPLALAEVRCAPRETALAGTGEEPWIQLLDRGASRRFAPARSPFPAARTSDRTSPAVDRGPIAAMLRQALAPDLAAVKGLAASARAAIGGDATLIDRQLATAEASAMPLPLVDRGAALVALDALGSPEARRKSLQRRLAGAVGARLRDREIPGSKWAHGGGCGVEIENVPPDQQTMVDCGMGNVPAESRRFLYFFTKMQD